jgi:hypothetical protein
MRIFLVGVAGFIAVYLYLFLYYFLTDQMEGVLCLYVNWFSTIPHFKDALSYAQFLLWGIQALLFLIAFLFVLARMNEWNISIRKMMLLGIYFLVFSVGSSIYMLDDLSMASLMPALPVSIFIATFLANRKRVSWLLEIFFLIWVAATFVHNLFIAGC